MKITIENFGDFDEEKLKNPKSFKDIAERTEAIKSFDDKKYPGLKEITDMNKLSFGHFIVLEQLLAIEEPGNAKIKRLAPYILRPESEKTLDNDDEDREDAHFKLVYSIQIGVVLGAFNRFIELRNDYLFKTYNGVIYGTVSDDDDKDEDGDGKEEGSVMSARGFHTKKFFWYSLVGIVCGDDIFKRQAAVELPMSEVMPFLAEKRSKAIIEELEFKANRLKK